jgi:hypothetical protein
MNYFNLFFTPTLYFYQRNSNQDRQDYDADLYYQHQWTRLTLGADAHFQHLTDASIDIGSLVEHNIYTTSLFGNYQYNDSLLLVGSASQVINQFPTRSSVNTNEWIANGYALYQVAPKLALGAGPEIGVIDIQGAPNESYQQLLMHLRYNPDGKLSATFSGGVEYLQYQDSATTRLFPIFDFVGTYTPTDTTVLDLAASRQCVLSYDLSGQNIEETSVHADVRQLFIQDVYLVGSLGFTLSDYEFGSLPGPSRSDKYYFASAAVEWAPKPWLKLSVRYQHSEDDSNFQTNAFEDDQVGFESTAFY